MLPKNVNNKKCAPKLIFFRDGGSSWKVGAQFTFLPLTRSIFDGFSKFFFLLKACFNCHFVKKWMRNCAFCAPSSADPAHLFTVPDKEVSHALSCAISESTETGAFYFKSGSFQIVHNVLVTSLPLQPIVFSLWTLSIAS